MVYLDMVIFDRENRRHCVEIASPQNKNVFYPIRTAQSRTYSSVVGDFRVIFSQDNYSKNGNT